MYKKELFIENYNLNTNTVNTDIDGLYVADFETSKLTADKNDVFVYATALMDVHNDNNICLHNNNINDFITNISNLPELESKIYFHNLSFDTIFCLLELFDKGFEQIRNKYKVRLDGGLQFESAKRTVKINREVAKVKKNDEEIHLKRPFSYNIIFNAGSFYRVDLYFDFETYKDSKNRKKSKLRKVSLMDSYKIVPSPLKRIAKDFLNYNMAKDGIDHSIIRPKNYNLNESEKNYLYEDVKILKDFLQLILIEGVEVTKDYKIFFDKMTTASQALNEYKGFLERIYDNNDYNNVKAFKECFKDVNDYLLKEELRGKKTTVNKDMLFNSIFPQLHPNTDCYLRQSYFGGITWKNKEKLNEILDNNIKLIGLVYDVNSLYPSCMRTQLLPYGKPKYYEGSYIQVPAFIKKEYPLYIQKLRVKMFNLKPGKMPNIQIRDSVNFKSSEYQKSNFYYDEVDKKEKYEECVFTFTSVQLKRFLSSYDTPLGVEYIDGYLFKGSLGLFDEYIDTFMELKETSQGARKATSKLCLNSLYGKFGTNPQREERIVEFDNGVFSTTNRDDEGNLLEYLSDSVYLPMASFITSYARDVLIEAVDNVFDRFLYCDTDSIHIIDLDVPDINIHESKIGAWKLEGQFVDAIYIGAKRYAELIEDHEGNQHWDIKCCGVSTDIIANLDDINVFNVCEYDGKQLDKILHTFYKKDDIYYYKDKECTQKVIGLLRSKKKLYVKGGVLIHEQPYAITDKTFIFNR